MRTFAALLLVSLSSPAIAASSNITLPVTFAGLPVGKLDYTVRLEGGRYTIDGEGATGGIGRLASKASSAFRARGTLGRDGPIPTDHSVSYRDGKKEGTAAIKFRDGRIVSVSETPPPTPRTDRIDVTEQMLVGAIDPTSALIIPAPADADIATICNRTIRVSDSRNLFTLTLAPLKSGRLEDGLRSHTCSVRYKALGGHRSSSKAVRRAEKNETLRITYAPIATDGAATVWGLVGFTVKSRFGRIRAEASGVDQV